MIKAIIVDDEMSGREGLSQLLKRFCPSVKIIDMCENIEQAVEAIRKGHPELVLLDIEMPL
ncbi:MAG: response regulator, partial [Bacteroidota bacterium]